MSNDRRNLFMKEDFQKEVEEYLEDKNMSFSQFARVSMKEKIERDKDVHKDLE